MRFPEVSECGNNQPTGTGDHPSRCGVTEFDYEVAELHFAGATIGNKNNFRRHLIGKLQHVGRISSGRLQSDVVPCRERLDHCFDRRPKFTQQWVVHLRVKIESARDPTDRAGCGQAVERNVDCTPAGQIQKIARREDATSATRDDSLRDTFFNALGERFHPFFETKTDYYFLQQPASTEKCRFAAQSHLESNEVETFIEDLSKNYHRLCAPIVSPGDKLRCALQLAPGRSGAGYQRR